MIIENRCPLSGAMGIRNQKRVRSTLTNFFSNPLTRISPGNIFTIIIFIFTMKTNMHLGAYGRLFNHARHSRLHPTKAEELLWERLRANQTGYKFRRQHPLHKYVVDFYCHALKLVIEVDGPIHREPINHLEDENKDFDLAEHGIEVLRLTNDQIINEMDQVMMEIYKVISLLQKKYRFHGIE